MPCESSSQPGSRRCLVQDRSGHQRKNRKPKAILDLSVNEKKKEEIQRVQQQTSKARGKHRHITTGISQRTSVSANREQKEKKGRKITQIQKGKGKILMMLQFYFIVGGIE